MGVRNRLFDRGIRKPTKLPRPVISVGNLTTGGTGKTPMVLHIARWAIAHGHRPAILLRGYKSVDGVSDEAEVYRVALGNQASVEPDPKRVAAAHRVLRRDPGVTLFILDDGFQHRQVHRDLDLLLISASNPFGYGRLLPRGLLREPAKNARRADAVVVTNAHAALRQEVSRIDAWVRQATGRLPITHAVHAWAGFVDAHDRRHDTSIFRGQRIAAACGIGNPWSFRSSLAELGAEVVESRAFPDHHVYTREELGDLAARGQALGAAALITTEKDWVKWKPLAGASLALPVYRPILEMTFLDGSDALETLLARPLRRRPEVAT